jgi:hypothetical protein
MSHNAKIGDIVQVMFHDHCEVEGAEDSALMEFAVYGVLSEKTRTHLTVTAWAHADNLTNRDVNTKSFTLVRKAVTNVRVLK